MVAYPVSVTSCVRLYRGNDAKKQFAFRRKIEDAKLIEEYLNRELAKREPGTIVTYTYYEIAREIGFETERVRELLFSVDAGHNGITIYRQE